MPQQRPPRSTSSTHAYVLLTTLRDLAWLQREDPARGVRSPRFPDESTASRAAPDVLPALRSAVRRRRLFRCCCRRAVRLLVRVSSRSKLQSGGHDERFRYAKLSVPEWPPLAALPVTSAVANDAISSSAPWPSQ